MAWRAYSLWHGKAIVDALEAGLSSLVGRFDLKADRAGGTLLVQACWSEPGRAPLNP